MTLVGMLSLAFSFWPALSCLQFHDCFNVLFSLQWMNCIPVVRRPPWRRGSIRRTDGRTYSRQRAHLQDPNPFRVTNQFFLTGTEEETVFFTRSSQHNGMLHSTYESRLKWKRISHPIPSIEGENNLFLYIYVANLIPKLPGKKCFTRLEEKLKNNKSCICMYVPQS